ncbi:MAG TPA: Hachiman antiphage defense system protein HamA [Chitinophagales bacterium]|nr:Hachiman antiphage defense system protein HamA [Chitinophagales bacterium]
MTDFARIIYEGILYYSYDENQLAGGDHQKMFLNALNKKFKFNADADEVAKRKLGIYGESILHAVLHQFYGTRTLVCRGYFYDIQKKSEVTGYDAFHLIQAGSEVELWFGEAKFHEGYKGALNDILKNIDKALSDEYLKTNFYAILQRRGNITDKNSKIYRILERWEKCEISSLEKELKDNKVKLVYPILAAFNDEKDYDKIITEAISHIKTKIGTKKYTKLSIDFNIFFIFLPIEDVKRTKLQVIKWITNQEPLML